MAGYGPPPANDKRRRNADAYEGHEVTVPADAKAQAPPLPNAASYLPATLTWYKQWADAPHAAAFLITDWQRLHMLAALVDQYWRDPATSIMTEIRLNETLLGATHVDRMRGRVKIGPAAEDKGSVTGGKATTSDEVAAARRKRLTGS